MKITISIQDTQRTLELTYAEGRQRWKIDGRSLEADGAEISPGVYSILIGGKSTDVRIQGSSLQLRVVVNRKEYLAAIENPRELRRNRAGGPQVEGRQSVVAPMAGKVIRLLVKAGDEVQSGEGLLIVEAMKMQNEIRSPKSGKVERVTVVEGQTVNPGETVAVIA
jgi:biotin carboxyl carrier protein